MSEKPDKMEMLCSLKEACMNCGMCDLGWQTGDDVEQYNPHVFSNFDPAVRLPEIMVVGQNPGWNEVCQKQPFVGDAGKNFDNELFKHDVDRKHLYITNAVKCFSKGNKKPYEEQVNACEPFLRMEINIIKPQFIVALGALAFNLLCPGEDYRSNLGKITKSKKFNQKVFAIYHPSPLNLSNADRRSKYEKDIRKLCKLMQHFLTPF